MVLLPSHQCPHELNEKNNTKVNGMGGREEEEEEEEGGGGVDHVRG